MAEAASRSAIPHASSVSCKLTGLPNYLVIDSRGSGESYPPSRDSSSLDSQLHSWPGGVVNTGLHFASPPGQAFAAQFQEIHPASVVAVEGNPYPAVSIAGMPVRLNGWVSGATLSPSGAAAALNGLGALTHIKWLGAYQSSITDGEKWLVAEIRHEESVCPSTQLILTGFSQGAQVTADVYQNQLSASERSRIAGVALYGDPKFNTNDVADDKGTASSTNNWHGILGRRPVFRRTAKVVSYCEVYDPVCDYPSSKSVWLALEAAMFNVHTSSYPADARLAAFDMGPATGSTTAPASYSVSLDSLCNGPNVESDSVNGCPYDGATTVGSQQFSYSAYVSSNYDSVYPSYWDLINFPTTTCRSAAITFGIPNGGGQPGDTVYLKVVDGTNSTVSKAQYGSVATLNVALDGQPWVLYNSGTSDVDQIAIKAVGSCATASGY